MSVEVLLSEATIQERIQALAIEISAVAPKGDRPLLLVGPLKGCVVLIADLSRALHRAGVTVELDFIGLSSYGSGTESSGTVTLLHGTRDPVMGRDVLLVDDIVDTGRTLAYAQSCLHDQGASWLHTAVLLDKPARRVLQVPVEHVGFQIEDVFVIGYGTDYAERYRELPFIGVLRQ